MKRVFVSSVIKGFEDYRKASRQAVELLVGFTPVMAEDFPAQARSPQAACLDGVQSSDVYIGILGPRYGSPTKSGLSATEEEFEEASRRPLPRLIFISTDQVDENQTAFIERLKGWGEGLYYAQFGSPDDLKNQIIKALSAMLGHRPALSQREAVPQLADLLDRVPDNGGVMLSLALVPSSASQPLIGLDQIDIFARELPTLAGSIASLRCADRRLLAKERSVELTCGGAYRSPLAMIEAFDDGRIVCVLEEPPSDRRDVAGSFIIDANWVQKQLELTVQVFGSLLNRLDQRGAVTTVYLQGRLKGIRGKLLDVMPEDPVNSMTVPGHDLPDPLPFPSLPHSVSAQELRRATHLAETLRSTLQRLFNQGLR